MIWAWLQFSVAYTWYRDSSHRFSPFGSIPYLFQFKKTYVWLRGILMDDMALWVTIGDYLEASYWLIFEWYLISWLFTMTLHTQRYLAWIHWQILRGCPYFWRFTLEFSGYRGRTCFHTCEQGSFLWGRLGWIVMIAHSPMHVDHSRRVHYPWRRITLSTHIFGCVCIYWSWLDILGGCITYLEHIHGVVGMYYYFIDLI